MDREGKYVNSLPRVTKGPSSLRSLPPFAPRALVLLALALGGDGSRLRKSGKVVEKRRRKLGSIVIVPSLVLHPIIIPSLDTPRLTLLSISG